ncbi:MAG: hypothetical protein WCQ66_08450 [Sphaerochaetaceae bacterium]|jgi:integrase
MDKLYRFRHPKGRHIQVMFRHIPGKWKDTGTNDVVDAVRFAEKHLTDDGITAKGGSITFGEFADGFYDPSAPDGFVARQKARRSRCLDDHWKAQADIVRKYLIPRFGGYLIDSISDVMVDDFVTGMRGMKGQEVSGNTKNKVLTCMREILQEAKRKHFLTRNVALDVTQIPETHKTRQPFTGQEIRLMFPKDDGELLILWGGLMWSTYFLVMRDTGFRPGEVAGLSKGCYLPRLHGIYTMQSANNRHELRRRIKTTGSGFPYKVGVLTEQADRFMRQLADTSRTDQLFTLRGRIVGTDAANKHLRGALAKAGIPDKGRTQYSFRHSFETAISGTAEDRILEELMAHTGYRPEYDHRTPETLLRQLQPVRKILEERGKDDQNVH